MMLLPEYLVCHIDTHHELVLLLPDGGRIAWPHLKPEIGHVDGRLRVVVVPVDPLERHLKQNKFQSRVTTPLSNEAL